MRCKEISVLLLQNNLYLYGGSHGPHVTVSGTKHLLYYDCPSTSNFKAVIVMTVLDICCLLKACRFFLFFFCLCLRNSVIPFCFVFSLRNSVIPFSVSFRLQLFFKSILFQCRTFLNVSSIHEICKITYQLYDETAVHVCSFSFPA